MSKMIKLRQEKMDSVYQFLPWLLNLLRNADLLPDFTSARGVFCAIAWLSTILSIGSLIIGFFMDGGDGDGDVGSGVDGDTGTVSLRTIIGFMLGLGWGGYVATQCGFGTGASICIGLVLGAIMFFIVAGIMRLIYSLKTDGSLNYSSLVGMTGTVYVTLPPHGEPGGQVQVSHPSQLITMAAVQFGDTPLPAQTRIIVEEATTYQLTVRPVTPAKF